MKCRDCGRKVGLNQLESVSRFGGGNYRRGGRYFTGQTCVRCIEGTLYYAEVRDGKITGGDTSRYATYQLVYALARFVTRGVSDLDEDRWRAGFPNNLQITFEDFFTALTRAVADAAAQQKKRAEEFAAAAKARSARA